MLLGARLATKPEPLLPKRRFSAKLRVCGLVQSKPVVEGDDVVALAVHHEEGARDLRSRGCRPCPARLHFLLHLLFLWPLSFPSGVCCQKVRVAGESAYICGRPPFRGSITPPCLLATCALFSVACLLGLLFMLLLWLHSHKAHSSDWTRVGGSRAARRWKDEGCFEDH